MGNVSDVLLKIQQLANQYNKKELPYYFSLYTIEVSVFKPIMALDSVRGILNFELGTSCKLAPAGTELLQNDIDMLREHTNAPEESINKLIEMNKEKYGITYT